MEKWFVIQKGADFQGIAQKFGIHPMTARLIRNRGIIGDSAIEKYLRGGIGDLYDPHLLWQADRLVDILEEKIRQGKPIRIIGDYDIDGVMSTYILCQGIRRCGGCVTPQIPDRIKDGYGINEHLIEEAYQDGIDTVITCDNGIAAVEEISRAKKLGMTVLVTDHHEVPYVEENGERRYVRSEADAIVNPRQKECPYPCKGLCGAAVAWKVIQILYERWEIPSEEAFDFLENVAFATVGDVMDLTDENRILVREGLRRIHRTKNIGMRALIAQNGLKPPQILAYHFGFVLGPCINASGRLETARRALNLFLEQDAAKAAETAASLVELNAQRKAMTAEGIEAAKKAAGEGSAGEKVLVIFLPEVHESLAGIIAGKIREMYHRPVFVLTQAEGCVKGSGRSVEEYSMYEELCKCRELFLRFGGHPMAAGISLPEENVDVFREKINACCELTDDDFIPKIKIDAAIPADYPDERMVRELELLAPYGKGNQKPQFADRNLALIRASVVGKNRNVLRLSLQTEAKAAVSAVYFGDVAVFEDYYAEKYGDEAVRRAFQGQENGIRMSIVFEPELNEYQGMKSVQLVIRNYQ